MNYRKLFLFVCLIVSPVIVQAKTLLVLGDSISAAYGISVEKGWVSLLEQRLVQNNFDYKVINASVVGETTIGAQMRLADLLEKHQPDIVVIELGGNDGLRGIALQEIENNFIKMVSAIKKVNSDVLLVPMEMPPNYGGTYRQGFAAIYKQVAEKMDVSISTFIFKNVADVPGLMQADGIHPIESAQPIMLENIWPGLSKLMNKDK